MHSAFSFTGSVDSTTTICLALGAGVLLQIRHQYGTTDVGLKRLGMEHEESDKLEV